MLDLAQNSPPTSKQKYKNTNNTRTIIIDKNRPFPIKNSHQVLVVYSKYQQRILQRWVLTRNSSNSRLTSSKKILYDESVRTEEQVFGRYQEYPRG